MGKKRLRWILIAALGVLVVALGAAISIFRPNLTPVERGRRLAEANGCFGCHGPEGIRGTPNPGFDEKKVPGYDSSLMMHVDNEKEVREWIRDGGTKSLWASETWKEERKHIVLKMPAFRDRLSGREIDDLASFVIASAMYRAPEDSLALAGRDRAEALGCFGCHGTGGQFARRNPGSLKGYIPPWDGADFTELVGGEAEFREWVEEGVGRRFRSNPIAQFFLKRAPLKMPAFREHLERGDVEAIWAYVQWLRSPAAKAH